MAPLERRLSAGWHRRSRMDARLWILGAVLLVIAAASGSRMRGCASRLSSAEPALVGIRDCILRRRPSGVDGQPSSRHAGDHAGGRPVCGRALPCNAARAPRGLRARQSAVAAATRRPLASGRPPSRSSVSPAFAAIGIWAFRVIAGRPEPAGLASAFGAIAATAITVLQARDLGEQWCSGRESAATWIDVVNHLRAAYVAAAAAMCIGLIAVRLHSGRPVRARAADGRHLHRAHDPPRLGPRALRPRGRRVPHRRGGRPGRPGARAIDRAAPQSCARHLPRGDRSAHRVPVAAGREGLSHHRSLRQARRGHGRARTRGARRRARSRNRRRHRSRRRAEGIRARRCSAAATSTRRWSRCCVASRE